MGGISRRNASNYSCMQIYAKLTTVFLCLIPHTVMAALERNGEVTDHILKQSSMLHLTAQTTERGTYPITFN